MRSQVFGASVLATTDEGHVIAGSIRHVFEVGVDPEDHVLGFRLVGCFGWNLDLGPAGDYYLLHVAVVLDRWFEGGRFLIGQLDRETRGGIEHAALLGDDLVDHPDPLRGVRNIPGVFFSKLLRDFSGEIATT